MTNEIDSADMVMGTGEFHELALVILEEWLDGAYWENEKVVLVDSERSIYMNRFSGRKFLIQMSVFADDEAPWMFR